MSERAAGRTRSTECYRATLTTAAALVVSLSLTHSARGAETAAEPPKLDFARQVQPIFITLDPERDTPHAMGEYVSYFLPGMEGLTVSTTEIADVARAFRVAYQKTKDPNSDQPYTIDHASMIFVMDKKGKFLRYFPPGVTADQLADVLSKAL